MAKYRHTIHYIVRVIERPASDDRETWFTGPFGSTEADHIANELEHAADHDRECYVEQLFAREED